MCKCLRVCLTFCNKIKLAVNKNRSISAKSNVCVMILLFLFISWLSYMFFPCLSLSFSLVTITLLILLICTVEPSDRSTGLSTGLVQRKMYLAATRHHQPNNQPNKQSYDIEMSAGWVYRYCIGIHCKHSQSSIL